ncbi:uncharacterized protein LOC123679972 isoform X2 [Harmonia axyridis]|uniref:uncharacterized protein LOC123679972 isoform X2 n=1 Tax=Harmonia axyridis TaxID=115357 RepID=UPI001E2757C1|nr:uncharacterized protein LOC123679972 isoform X2 [Harmonia axyridis]
MTTKTLKKIFGFIYPTNDCLKYGSMLMCACDFHRNLNLEEVDLISEKSLRAVEELVLLLKGYVHNNWIFRPRPHINSFSVEEKVYHALRKGNKRSLHRLVTRDRAEDGVSGLQIFLTKLKQPIIPQFIQALAVDENKGITADIVAVDMLGLMRQNLLPRHLRLITAVFDLLHCAVKNTHTDELKGSAVPLSMLPIFFQLETLNIPRWRRLVAVLMEMIRLAPSQLNIAQHPEDQQVSRIPR